MKQPKTKATGEQTPALTPDQAVAAIMADLTPQQASRIDALIPKATERAAGAKLKPKLSDDRTLTLSLVHKNTAAAELLMMADLGTCDPAFMYGLLSQVAVIGAEGRTVDNLNSDLVLAVIRSIEPRDELEAMLAAQMGGVHVATMAMARRLIQAKTIPQQDAAERALNKLARTFATQVEALKRYRNGGQQKVVVEHVTVNAGGQAIVGTVSTGGEGAK
jgi:hypothetical protein